MIRQLRDDEPIPTTTPRRYVNQSGYIRLRWHVGGKNHVEAYEHRVVAGRPAGHVHHVNGKKDDNDPSNLVVLSQCDHAALHGGKRKKFNHEEAVLMYADGFSTTAIAEACGVNSATVYRALAKQGVEFRKTTSYWEKDVDLARVREMHGAGLSTYRIAAALGVTQTVIQNRVERLGLTPHKPGRHSAIHQHVLLPLGGNRFQRVT